MLGTARACGVHTAGFVSTNSAGASASTLNAIWRGHSTAAGNFHSFSANIPDAATSGGSYGMYGRVALSDSGACHIGARGWAHPSHIGAGAGLDLPHLRRDWARPSHICAGTGLTRSIAIVPNVR